jgi:hypothetical protein
MTFPTIPDLPPASDPDNTDQLLLRQPAGALGQDKSVTVQQIQNINIPSLNTLPTNTTPVSTDQFIVNRAGVNYRVNFRDVGFITGTKMWFFANSDSQIPGWTQTGTGDTLLAVKGGSTYTQGGIAQGTWQQVGHSLTGAEMPRHAHGVFGAGSVAGSGAQVKGFKANPLASTPPLQPWATNFTGGTSTEEQATNGSPHNHGNTWRPFANVGIICEKD